MIVTIIALFFASKLAEHGDFFDEDANSALLLSCRGGNGQTIRTSMQTTQIAPTILSVRIVKRRRT